MMRSLTIHFLRGAREGQSESIQLPEGDEGLLIGRQPDCGIRFDATIDTAVSGHHARIFEHDGSLWIEDLGSTNGTFLNNIKLLSTADTRHPEPLTSGDKIAFGRQGPQVQLLLPEELDRKSGRRVGRQGLSEILTRADQYSRAGRRTSGGKTILFLKEFVRQSATESTAGVKVWLTSITLLILVMIGFGVYGILQLREAQQERRKADEAQISAAEERARAEAAQRELLAARQDDLTAQLQSVQENQRDLDARIAAERAERQALFESLDNFRVQIGEMAEQNTEELAALRADLAQEFVNRAAALEESESNRFRAIANQARASVFLLLVRFEVTDGSGAYETVSSTGTGFVVNESGLMLTNKHVIKPWLFPGLGQVMQSAGLTVRDGSYQVFAWPVGAEAQGPSGLPRLDTSFHTGDGTLTIAATAPDDMTLLVDSETGERFHLHRMDTDNDVAVLRLPRRVGGWQALPLYRPLDADSGDADWAPEQLQPVLVVGFPFGFQVLEGDTVETSPALGEIRKVQDTILISAPIAGGNSGGPCLAIRPGDGEARVIGIATRTASGYETLGTCIKIEHTLAILDRAATSPATTPPPTGDAEDAFQAALIRWEAAHEPLGGRLIVASARRVGTGDEWRVTLRNDTDWEVVGARLQARIAGEVVAAEVFDALQLRPGRTVEQTLRVPSESDAVPTFEASLMQLADPMDATRQHAWPE